MRRRSGLQRSVNVWRAALATALVMGSLSSAVFASAAIGSSQAAAMSSVPAAAGPATRRTISTGWAHACALLVNGTAKCWGDNDFGELGNGTRIASSKPVVVKGLTNAVAISAGGYYTCALLANKTAKCWGENFAGQLGNGTKRDSLKPVVVKGLTNAIAIATSAYAHTCALLANGTARCWGANSYGELGTGTKINSAVPLPVRGVTHATAISAGYLHSCVVVGSGIAKCWGDNSRGELGNGTTTPSKSPVAVSGLTNATAISASNNYSCALLADGTARCWGNDILGDLGDGSSGGSTGLSSVPVVVSGLTSVVALSTQDAYQSSCAVLADKTARCWGWNGHGGLGDGVTPITPGCPPGCSSTPVVVTGVNNVVQISAGAEYACELSAAGTAECWGRNDRGQLGNGTKADSPTPVAVSGKWRV